MNYDIIGDIHGCYEELSHLLHKLGYEWNNENIPIHPEERILVFLGDLTDRGPHSVAVMELVYRLVKKKKAYYTPGNHCNKLYRYLIGRNVQVTHGLETTVEELKALEYKKYKKVATDFKEMVECSPLYLILDNKKLIVAHAGLKREWIGKTNNRIKTFVLYGDITGESEDDGRPVRRDWAKREAKDGAWIVYGHTPVLSPRIINHTINIDTGCVFGGKLTAFRYPELTTVSVPSKQPFVPEKFRSFDD
ncbi:bis(5'-nucleosyl)-tetraphosphatase PrpE [Pueribacillus theae]|uniref:Bis(5'-nucleosyl)-tetraphosphatase PrpE n=1 Tax=Pueribacillus theae TaxID=2171751 RepID=A0A2U1K5A2_9BACI|nr:bis(5'-nucleosyl)-tetraphosphatase PrpE [Pueribacillus theae]PWA12691.1 bis(5'-nucleosyl)-tetraphosphatase PrpE [Pueribacillus theae]